MNKTPLPNLETLEQKWYVIDAADQRLGRLATEIAMILRGKNKATFTPIWIRGILSLLLTPKK